MMRMISYYIYLYLPLIDIVYPGRALDHRSAITNYVAKDRDLRKFELLPEDWKNIELVCEWLKVFRSATTQMSTTSKPMLSSTSAIFRGLQDRVKEAIRMLPADVDTRLRKGLVDAHLKLSEYYHRFDQSCYFTWAAHKSCIPVFTKFVDPNQL